jgi:ATP-dependent protease HslVU (ClpYQ) peptidase subunit
MLADMADEEGDEATLEEARTSLKAIKERAVDILADAATRPKAELQLHSRDAIFQTFLKLHPQLKDRFFLNTKEHDSDPYESSQYSILIANRSGIFGVESYREVFEFERFWAIGSGRRFALGGMHTAWGRAKTAREVATAGVLAGCEFDTCSAGPVRVQTFKLKT